MKELTHRQQEVLDFIIKFKQDREYSPTFQEVAEYFGITKKSAYDQIKVLVKKRLYIIYREDKQEHEGDCMNNQPDIEQIVKDMTEAAKEFYKDPKAERNMQKCIKHRDFLQELYNKVIPNTDREKEVGKILDEAIKYFTKQITRLARYH
jgi:SOS-response transcriptional repressor LexA